MSRSVWSGQIGFGLVSIPVSLHSAEDRQKMDFTMLDRTNLAPVKYQRVNEKTGDEVKWKDIVKGFQYEKGKYVVLSENDFKRANVKASHTIEIQNFVSHDEIDPAFYEKPYYIQAESAEPKGYALLREVLKGEKKVAICKVVIHGRQHLGAVRPQEDRLVLEIMRFGHELRDVKDIKVPSGTLKKNGITAPEIRMAKQLVEGMTVKWDPSSYKDTYFTDLQDLIKEKIRSGKTESVDNDEVEETEKFAGDNVHDLMPLLKQSLAKATHKDVPAKAQTRPRKGK